MDKEEFELLNKVYAPIVVDIINKNVRFYRFNKTIQWCFGFDEDVAIMAVCDRKTNVITINLKSFMKAYFENDFKTVEYYLLHEIRHIFQHEIIKDYKSGLEIPLDKNIVEKWIYEGEHYIASIDKNGNENPDYFYQDSEMDAYAFSYAVMKYKYHKVDLYIPPVYGSDFYDIVNEWIDVFKEEKL